MVREYAGGLVALGLRRGDTVAIMTANGPAFRFVDTAAVHIGAIPISIYATLPPHDIAWILENADVSVVIAEADFLPVLEQARSVGARPFSLVSLADTGGDRRMADAIADAPHDFDFDAAWRAVRPEDPVTVSYTSGTTGNPKGVVLSNGAVLGSLDALDQVTGTVEGGRVISFLPMAHVAERMFSHYRGIRYGLTLTSCPHPSLVPQYLTDVRPHYVFSPPRLFEKLRSAIEARSAGAEPAAVATREAIATGLEVIELQQTGQPVPTELSDRYHHAREQVLTPILAKLGLDQVEVALTGSAPVPPGLVRFFLALGLPALEAWGMSECTAFGSINRLDDVRTGTVGYPLPGLELRLDEDGEILLRSPFLMSGYLNQPELTAETIDSDGWLHTGDIGSHDADGRLQIIDRKKELIISAFGKNMSPSNIEAKLKEASPLVGQAVVIGDSRPYNVALLVLDVEVAASTVGGPTRVEELVGHPEIVAAIDAAVEAANERLARVEQVKRYVLLPDEWLPGGDELSPTMKLKRRPISDKYAETIESLYSA
ncbi:Long-chain-fatty-acid--CoA ligase [Pseudonocardia sp. Ae168_Ps1]|nr:Long-chain-fatty-acid--CoA ligase [Pseudonocardia sp. Ae150A_Ps1]OLL79423.1 Long-chain-fatty-acid--CoA ligase [Pseudonocardia sp. Ae168_Ps1]OLL86443.1 Long-chain-fatty-acid--CoA ligase [Pseudonocardia sp. Ae263_Ps1]OLL93516.1 Long-chain-fatty-acid--CoA ligase [Pseudonocardia sp. Ae356_Ps1]